MHFEKISLEQWIKDFPDENPIITEEIYNNLKLPKQSTIGSAGMDFFIPCQVTIQPKCYALIPTGIRWVTDKNTFGFVLSIYPRSGMGFKTGIRMANTVGIIDETYYQSDNEGHIMIKMYNPSDQPIVIEEGKAFCQGIITKYYICDDAESDIQRNGGFGSTDKKQG